MALQFGSGAVPGLSDMYSGLERDEALREQRKEEFKIKQEEFKVKRTEKFNETVGDLFYDNSIMKNKLQADAQGDLQWTGTDSLPDKALALKNYKHYAKRYGQKVDFTTFENMYQNMIDRYSGQVQNQMEQLMSAGYDESDFKYLMRDPKFKNQMQVLMDNGHQATYLPITNTQTTADKMAKYISRHPGLTAGVIGGTAAGAGYLSSAAYTSEELVTMAQDKFKTWKDLDKDVLGDKWNKYAKKNKLRANKDGSFSKKGKKWDKWKARELGAARKNFKTTQQGTTKAGRYFQAAKDKFGGVKGGPKVFPAGYARTLGVSMAPQLGRFVGSAFGKEGELIGGGAGAVGLGAYSGYGLSKAAYAGGKGFLKYLSTKLPTIAAKIGATSAGIAMADSPAPGFADVIALLYGAGMSIYEMSNVYDEWKKLQRHK